MMPFGADSFSAIQVRPIGMEIGLPFSSMLSGAIQESSQSALESRFSPRTTTARSSAWSKLARMFLRPMRSMKPAFDIISKGWW